jgi:hypothetical protein
VSKRFALIAGFVATAGLAVGAIMVGTSESEPPDGREALTQLIEQRTSATASGTYVGPSTLADSLPNVRHDAFGGRPASRSVVVARVVKVGPGEGLYRERRDDPTSPEQTVSYDDKRAQYRTLSVTLNVEDVVAGTAGTTETVKWLVAGPNLPGNGYRPQVEDPEAVSAALRELGSSLWLLMGPDRILDYGYRWVATIGSSGRLTFPFYEPDDPAARERWVGGLDTVDKVRAEGRKAERSVSTGGAAHG